MGTVLLVNTDKVKRATPIQNNVEDSILIPYITKSQDTHIQELLGTDLYNKIISEIAAATITGDYKVLLDTYIIPCLIEWSFYEVLPFINFKITNKSIVKGTSDYSAESDLEDLKYIRNASRDMAEFYSNRLTGYLKQYTSLFPEYLTNSGLDKLQPVKRQNFFGGIYTGQGDKGCNYGLGIGINIR